MSPTVAARPFVRVWLTAVLAMALAIGITVPRGEAVAQDADSETTVRRLLVDGRPDPLGVGAPPVFSWQLDAERRGVSQSAHQIRVAPAASPAEPVWDSGRVDSHQQLDVPYDGPELASRTSYVWQVRIWDESDRVSPWSERGTFVTGTLDATEWTGAWIGADAEPIGDEWTDVTVRFDATIEGAVGLYLRGLSDGDAYMWQLSDTHQALRPHVKQDGDFQVLDPVTLDDDLDLTERHTYEVSIVGDTITTAIDGDVVDVRQDTTHEGPGIIGFRTHASEGESGEIHDLEVTSSDGTELLRTDFETDEGLFRAGEVRDGALVLDGNAEAWLVWDDPVPLLRCSVEVDDDVVAAHVVATSRGIYQLTMNGQRVGDDEFAPGWTDYRERIAHQTYDVTALLRDGDNVLGAELADGWYSGNVAMFGPNHYGTENSLLAELVLTHADGSTTVVPTDDSWTTTPGPRRVADILDGETYDARVAAELDGWDEPGFDASDWEPVTIRDEATDVVEPQIDPPVRVTEELEATYLSSPEPGVHVYDLGQNMVGKVRVTLEGEAGDRIQLRHAEVLNPDGTMYVANLRRDGMAVDRWILTGDGPETYEPVFTFHGFRYVEVSGVEDPPDAADIVGVVTGTDGELVNELSTSSPMVNQLQSNISWGMRGNFLSVPTDTPARDERMGWTGDINVFARTAVYNMDSQAFLRKWLLDLRDTQAEDGSLPGVAPVVPDVFDGGYGPAGWADAGVNVPYVLWETYADTRVIHENYEMMTRFVDYLDGSSVDGIRSVGGYDDWLNLDDPTPSAVIDTAFVAKSSGQLAEMAAAIGEDDDAAHYQALHESTRDAFIGAFVEADGTVLGDSQTAYILTITNDLIPDGLRDEVADRFIETIERRDWHLSTGFLGVDGLLPALTEIGRTDVAYRLLTNTSYPSWGYAIDRGATTVWERWNSIMPDGSFGPVSMNSFNHYAYGAVGEWMYRTMAGIDALEPGFRRVLVAPELGEQLDHVDVTYGSPYGPIRSAWEHDEDGLELEVTIPAGASGVVVVPTDRPDDLTEGGVPVAEVDGVTDVEVGDGEVRVHVGSGDYAFSTVLPLPSPEPLECPAADPDGLSDVPADSLHRDAIGCASALGLLLGKVDGRFDPAGRLTRGQMASLVVRLADAVGHPAPTSSRSFPDVAAANVHASAIAGAAEAGYLLGWPDGTMRPGEPLRRGQFASVMVRLIEDVTGEELPVGPAFPDAGAPHGEALAKARLVGVVEGRTDGRVEPNKEIRRDQVASIVVRSLPLLPSIQHVGRAELAVAGDLYSGSRTPIEVEVRNRGQRDLRGLALELDLPAGWRIEAENALPEVVAVGGRAAGTYRVVVADDAEPGPVVLEGALRYARPGGTGSLPVTAQATVGPPVVVTGVEVNDDSAPGGTAGLDVAVHNRGAVDVEGELGIELPDGWAAPEPTPFSLASGASTTVSVEVPVPHAVTEGVVPVVAYLGEDDDERRAGQLTVAFDDPSGVVDHIDLGDEASEAAHGLTASEHSGTSTEAGLTRRYTNAQYPGGWFEFDLEVPSDGPYVLRMVETYDQPQLKDYTIRIDGEVVHERRHRRSDSGAGTVTYQIVVPAERVGADTVRVRFEDTGVGYDPSIADVWSLPITD